LRTVPSVVNCLSQLVDAAEATCKIARVVTASRARERRRAMLWLSLECV
jgi:hypothetical protein